MSPLISVTSDKTVFKLLTADDADVSADSVPEFNEEISEDDAVPPLNIVLVIVSFAPWTPFSADFP